MWVLVDTRVPIEALLRGVVVQSGNDAAIVVAEALAGTEDAFADLMNQKARALGMTNTHFANATGWPDENHYSTPRDLAILGRYIISEFPEYYGYFKERDFTWSDIRQPNRNPLIYDTPGADGLKTGHTEDSGFGLVGTAARDGKRRIIVVHGLESEEARAREGRRLLEIAFNDFRTERVLDAGDVVGEAQVWMGARDGVPLRLNEPAEVIVHRLARRDLHATMIYDGPVAAPIEEGRQIGMLRLEGPGVEPRLLPLYAAESAPETGFFGKVAFALDRLVFGDPSKIDNVPEVGDAAAQNSE